MHMKDANGVEVIPQFPRFIDSNLRADLAGCQRLFYYRHVLGLRPTGPTGWHLHFGHCFAKSLEVFRLAFYGENVGFAEAQARGAEALIRAWGDYPPEAAEDAADSIRKKTLYACLDAFKSYLIKYPPATDHIKPLLIEGKPAVEFTFALPIPDCYHPDTGEPMLYCGRFDMLGEYGKAVMGLDDKTTTQLGPTWPLQWRMRSQLTGYVWAAKQYGYPIQGMCVRGNAILTKDITHAEAIEQRPQWMIDRWLLQMQHDLRAASEAWKSGYWNYNLDDKCGHFGGCTYLRLDTVKDIEPWITADFVVNRWDPLAVNED